MINQPLPPFNNVVANGIATVKIPRYAFTLNKIVLCLGGTFTKAMITDIKLKLGVRLVYQLSGPQLDIVNKYKGIYDEAGFLTLDFTERDSFTLSGKEIGGYDLQALKDDLTIEVTIAGATSPTLSAIGFFSPPQGNTVVLKMVQFTASVSVAGKFVVPFNVSGATVKRIHLIYAGTDGNLNRVEFKKDGFVLHDMTHAQNQFTQREYRKVPQAKHHCIDWIVDNNANSMLMTANARSLELNTFLTAADSMVVIAELIDLPANA